MKQIEKELGKAGGESEKTRERFKSLKEDKEKLKAAMTFFLQ